MGLRSFVRCFSLRSTPCRGSVTCFSLGARLGKERPKSIKESFWEKREFWRDFCFTMQFFLVLAKGLWHARHHFAGSWCTSTQVAIADACERVLWYFGVGAWISDLQNVNLFDYM